MNRLWLSLVGVAACDRPGSVSIYDLDADGMLAGVDCNDRDASVGPSAPEVCNGRDDDCDGEVDEDLLIRTWLDADRDGFGAEDAELVLRCATSPGWVENHRDCDDADPGVHPDQPEVCDGRDQDCDTIADEGLSVFVSYLDVDQDNFGRPDVTVTSCDIPFGYANNDRDCDDLEPTVNPNGIEVCNRIDENCDGVADEGLTVLGWVDADGDGFGNESSVQPICPYDDGFVVGGGDCDDGDPTVSPDAHEVCNGFDDDCDGIEDDGVGTDWFLDADGDGFGDPDAVRGACLQPAGFVADATDCDDLNAVSFPGGVEVCDDLDNDCNALVDDGLNTVWYADLDGDGLGDPYTRVDTCVPAPQFVQVDGDCDDSDAAVPPACPPTLFGRWTNHGGDSRRSGHAMGTVGVGTLSLQWELDLGAPLDPVAAGDGRVFATVGDGSSAEVALVALEIDSGVELWKRVVGPANFVSGATYAIPQVCVAVGKGAASEIVCVDADTGVDAFVASAAMQTAQPMAPIEYAGKLYTAGGLTGGLHAHFLFTGAGLWFDALPNQFGWGASAFGDTIYVWDGGLYSLDALTGLQNWLTNVPYGYPALPTTPVIGEDGVAYLGGSVSLAGFDVVNRVQSWTQAAPTNGFPAVDGDQLYVIRSTGVAEERSTATGALVRTFAGSSGLVGPPIVTDDALIVSSATTTWVYDRATGALLQSVPDGGALTVADNHLLLAEPSGFLHAYTW